MAKYEQTRKLKRQLAILVGEDEEGMLGLTCGDFPVSSGEAESEFFIDDIPIKLEDIPHTVLHRVVCLTCNKVFWVREKNDVRACPCCCSGAIQIDTPEAEERTSKVNG